MPKFLDDWDAMYPMHRKKAFYEIAGLPGFNEIEELIQGQMHYPLRGHKIRLNFINPVVALLYQDLIYVILHDADKNLSLKVSGDDFCNEWNSDWNPYGDDDFLF